jgi:thiol-disulfide isomerase/thioredoxin
MSAAEGYDQHNIDGVPMRTLLALFAMSCTPHLVSEVDEITGENWVAPENSWDAATPPANLKATGFGVGRVPEDFRLKDQFGDEVSLWQFYGDVILVDISTMWCGPCQLIAREVSETWHDYRDQGFTYLTLLPEDLGGDVPDNADLNTWADDFGIDAPVLSDGARYGYRVEPDELWPVVMLVDRRMKVIVERIPANEDAIREAIEAAL